MIYNRRSSSYAEVKLDKLKQIQCAAALPTPRAVGQRLVPLARPTVRLLEVFQLPGVGTPDAFNFVHNRFL